MLTPEAKQLDAEATACFKEWIEFMGVGFEANVPLSERVEIAFVGGYAGGKSAGMEQALETLESVTNASKVR